MRTCVCRHAEIAHRGIPADLTFCRHCTCPAFEDAAAVSAALEQLIRDTFAQGVKEGDELCLALAELGGRK